MTSFEIFLTKNRLDGCQVKLPPGALLTIADDLLADIYTIWLRLADVCRLDSAVCAKMLRHHFLRLISTKVLRFNRERSDVLVLVNPYKHRWKNKELGITALNWILFRGVHLASIRLPDDYIADGDQERIRAAVVSLVSHGRLDKVENIDLHDCDYIRYSDLSVILEKSYASVEMVDISRCPGLTVSMAALIKRCTGLKAFTTNGNESAGEMAEIFQSCKKLYKVGLTGFRSGIIDELLMSVADHCRLLVHLGVGYSYRAVSDEAVRRVAKSCPLLEYVCLSFTDITDASVIALCTHCPRIKVILLGGCKRLTDASVLAMAERLSGLTYFSLEDNDRFTSGAAETLVARCNKLNYINLEDCLSVCDATLSAIAIHCSFLEILIVTGCPLVTEIGLIEVGTLCPNIIFISIDRTHPSRARLDQLSPSVMWLC